MHGRPRPSAIALVALGVVVAGASGQDGDEKVVFTVGITNDVDSLNPIVGVEVPDYEVWNIQYATLTDKASATSTPPRVSPSRGPARTAGRPTPTSSGTAWWSDGQPLTADDVAFTVNRARDEEWLNYSATVANLRAVAVDPQTVRITSSVPDPKLPTMDVYILPKHIWDKYDKAAITKYNGLDGVGSGPFTNVELKRGQFWKLQANPNYWGGKPAVDEVIFRLFNNRDAMVAALKQGEIDAAHDVPSNAFKDLESTDGIVTVQGQQGGFNELADQRQETALAKPLHTALLDLRVRQAIAHAIDKQTIVDRVLVGLGTWARR